VSPLAVKRCLASRGYQEVVTYSFVEASQQEALRPDLTALPLANPISSELGVMRTTLVGGLISTLQRNLARQSNSMALFETGLRFLSNPSGADVATLDKHVVASYGDDLQSDQSVQQQNMLAGLVAGERAPENWNAAPITVDFFSVKADVENLFKQANGAEVKFVPTDLAMLHPGQSACIQVDGVNAGYIGVLNPSIQRELDLSAAPVVFELSLEAVCQSRVPKAAGMSRFPQVRRDIALLLDRSVSYQSVLDVVRAEAPEILRDVKVFDVYHGDKLPEGKKSEDCRRIGSCAWSSIKGVKWH